MPDLAVIKATPQTADAPRQSAKKPDNRPADDEKRPEFQSEYDTGNRAEASTQEDTASEEDAVSSDEGALSAKRANDTEAYPEEAPDVDPADTVDTVDIDTPPDSFALAASGDALVKEETQGKRPAVDGMILRQEDKPRPAAAPGAAETRVTGDAVDTAQARPEPATPPAKTGKSTAETVIMSKVAEAENMPKAPEKGGASALSTQDDPLRPGAHRGAQDKPAIVPPATAASDMAAQVANPAPGKREKTGDWRRLGPEMAAETARQKAPGLTAVTRQQPNFSVTQAQIKPGALKEKIELVPFSGSDVDSMTALDARSATQASSTALPQHLNRAETPMMIGRQMAEALQKAQDRPVEIALNPRELGRVRMSISAAEAGITVSVIAERPETLDLMRRNIEQLAREFQTIGYENIAFSFSGGEARQDFSEQQNDENRPAVTRLDLTSEDNPEVPAPRAVATSGVDLRL